MMILDWILFGPKCSDHRVGSSSGVLVVGEVKGSISLEENKLILLLASRRACEKAHFEGWRRHWKFEFDHRSVPARLEQLERA